MRTEQSISDFYNDVAALGLPGKGVADITRATKWKSKGQVSMMLSGKRKPSKKFLIAFYNAFPKGSQKETKSSPNGHVEEAPDIDDAKTYWLRFDQLLSMAERNSNIIDKLSEALLERKISSGKTVPYSGLPGAKDKEAQKAARGVNGGKSKTHLTVKRGKQKDNGSDAGK